MQISNDAMVKLRGRLVCDAAVATTYDIVQLQASLGTSYSQSTEAANKTLTVNESITCTAGYLVKNISIKKVPFSIKKQLFFFAFNKKASAPNVFMTML